MALKVWGGIFDGTTRQIVATKTKKAAAEALGLSYYHFNEYACDTGNDVELRVALAEPGVVFSSPGTSRNEDKFIRGNVRYVRGGPWPPAGYRTSTENSVGMEAPKGAGMHNTNPKESI